MKARAVAVSLLVVIAGLSACTYRVRESNVVIPRAAPATDFAALRAQFPGYRIDQTRIAAPDGAVLQAIRFLRSDAVATVLYFGGNGYTVAKMSPVTARTYLDSPVSFVLVDHRGYGGSSGTPTMQALLSDAVTVYDSLLDDPELRSLPLIVHGHSLGSFMAGQVAGQRRLAGVVLESSMTRTEDWTAHLRSQQSAWVRLLVRRVVPDAGLAGQGNADVASMLDEPALFVVGADDDVTPPRFTWTLFDAAPLSGHRKHLLIVPRRGHMNATDSPVPRRTVGVCRTGRGRAAREPALIRGKQKPLPPCKNMDGGAGQTVASPARVPRKVRAPQGTVPGNAWAARADGKCNRKIPPMAREGSGKGEMVR